MGQLNGSQGFVARAALSAALIWAAACGAPDSTGGNTTGGAASLPPGATGQPGGAGTLGNGASAGTGTASGATGNPGTAGTVTGAIPCSVDTVVKSRCQLCHGATPIGGAPLSLVTLADFQQMYTPRSTQQLVGHTMKVYELARIRVNGQMGTAKMPQGGQLAAQDFSALDGWLGTGAPAGMACAGTSAGGGTTNPPAGGGMTGGSAGAGGGTTVPSAMGYPKITPTTPDVCANDPTQFQPLVARQGETCYEFQTHGVSSPTDKTKFTVQTGESYNQFYFAIPWPAGTLASRFGAKFDNLAVLHHWLGFSSSSTNAPGTVSTNVTGTTLGENAELVGGWAVGGCNVDFGPDMGLKLPDSGAIMIQWHHFNNTNAPAQDASIVQWCTVPAGMRKNVGGLTFLGTENFDGPVGMPIGMSQYGGTCTNNSGKPITILGFNPHEHLLGVGMTSTVTKAAGGMEVVFDHPFQFDHQVNYMLNPGYVLQPGDSIESHCTFNNTTTANVPFGQSTKQEMCYQFTFSYPYGALNNGALSLIGATNTCW